MRRLFLAVTLLLTGCAGFNPFGPGPVDPEDATAKPDLVLTGAGVLKFQCSADKDGYWWRFIAPEVVLMNPAGRKIATQGADFNFTAPDKSKLSSKIVSSAPGKTDADLKDVLFRVTPAGKIKTGTLTPYRWVKRDEAKGRYSDCRLQPQFPRQHARRSLHGALYLLQEQPAEITIFLPQNARNFPEESACDRVFTLTFLRNFR